MTRAPLWVLLTLLSFRLVESASAAPPAATAKPGRATGTPADRCRQLAAAWWGDRPGIYFREIDPAVAVPACKRAVENNPKDIDLKAYLCHALQQKLDNFSYKEACLLYTSPSPRD